MEIKKTRKDNIAEFEEALERSTSDVYILRLYVSGVSPKSIRAIHNVKKICQEYLAGRYQLEIIDVYEKPKLAAGEEIIAVPTLIKKLPAPLRRLIGDMSNIKAFLLGMDLVPPKTSNL
jgi:circadian clock protein KaiB